jgi:hypothetical protein
MDTGVLFTELKKAFNGGFKYENNAEVVINEADFEIQDRLHRAILNSMVGSGKGVDYLLKLFVDPEVDKLLWECLQRCTYNKEKITKETFNDSKAKPNYYPIKCACLHKNIAPFMTALSSLLASLMAEEGAPQ